MADQCGLAEHHGQRIAVLETEFGEIGVDH
jgi:G3E family GTPase